MKKRDIRKIQKEVEEETKWIPYEQYIKEKKCMAQQKITKEGIEKAFNDLFYNKTSEQKRKEGIPYSKKLENDSWEIFTGYNTFFTNDAGKAQFDKAVMEQGLKLLNNGENNKMDSKKTGGANEGI